MNLPYFRIIGFAGFILMNTACGTLPGSLSDATSGATNSIIADGNSQFHRTVEKRLETSDLIVKGEVRTTGKVDLSKYYKREVFVRETIINDNNVPEFVGAFRYKGYSLFDLLNPYIPDKKNAEIFSPAIDIFIIIENDKGESVAFSWSEIYHTINPHQILIATEVAPINPFRREVEYKTGKSWKLISANDLYSNRFLENPVSITIRSFDKRNYPIIRDLDPMYSPDTQIVFDGGKTFTIPRITDSTEFIRYHSTFFGMGMGYHGNHPFIGLSLSTLLDDSIQLSDKEWIRKGLVCCASVDGFRSVFSYSELFNRADQVDPMLSIPHNPYDGGYYRIFIPSDFYADRSVKSLKELFFFKII